MTTELVKAKPSPEALELRPLAEALIVTTREDFTRAGGLVVRLRTIVKKRRAEDEPGIISAKEHWELLKIERDKKVAEIEEIIKIIEPKAEAWAREERRLAKVEEDRKNAELRRQQEEKAEADRAEAERIAKAARLIRVAEIRQALKEKKITLKQSEKLLREAGAAEEAAQAAAALAAEETRNAPPPTVKVEAAVPKVAGIKRRVNYKAEIIDSEAFFKDYTSAILNGNSTRLAFLQTFICIDQSAVGEYARNTKNTQIVSAALPGVKAWEEDSI